MKNWPKDTNTSPISGTILSSNRTTRKDHIEACSKKGGTDIYYCWLKRRSHPVKFKTHKLDKNWENDEQWIYLTRWTPWNSKDAQRYERDLTYYINKGVKIVPKKRIPEKKKHQQQMSDHMSQHHGIHESPQYKEYNGPLKRCDHDGRSGHWRS
jgi:hypothetical protein